MKMINDHRSEFSILSNWKIHCDDHLSLSFHILKRKRKYAASFYLARTPISFARYKHYLYCFFRARHCYDLLSIVLRASEVTRSKR